MFIIESFENPHIAKQKNITESVEKNAKKVTQKLPNLKLKKYYLGRSTNSSKSILTLEVKTP